MNVLTVYANPNPKSFCHAILEQFDRGLRDAGHKNEIVDLYAIKFNPVLGTKDGPCWVNEGLPMELLEDFDLKKQAELTTNNPLMRMLIRMYLRNKSTRDLLRLAKDRRPKDVVEQQEKIAKAQGLAIVAELVRGVSGDSQRLGGKGFYSGFRLWIEHGWMEGQFGRTHTVIET